ncbi:hypothetical protein [Streptosporangium sp. NPDC048865]|uniref:hypothetical protein n=1 Tax=Streptosporangium sp. NPDC048865 TaxID=3155766 RepID=UPI003427C564
MTPKASANGRDGGLVVSVVALSLVVVWGLAVVVLDVLASAELASAAARLPYTRPDIEGVAGAGDGLAKKVRRVREAAAWRTSVFVWFVAVAAGMLGTLAWLVRRRRSVALSFWAGTVTTPYLCGLGVALWSNPLPEPRLTDPYGEALRIVHPYWHTPARASVIVLAAAVHVGALILIARSSARAAGGPASARPLAAAFMAATATCALAVAALNFLGIAQARAAALGEVFAEGADTAGGPFRHPGMAGRLLDLSVRDAWVYAALLAVAALVACAVAVAAVRGGNRARATAATLAGVVVLPYMAVLLATAALGPFVHGNGEPVHRWVSEGPGWYRPVVWSLLVAAAITFVAGSALVTRSSKPSRPTAGPGADAFRTRAWFFSGSP